MGDLYDYLMGMRVFTLIMNRYPFDFMTEVATTSIDYANHHLLIACIEFYKKWVNHKKKPFKIHVS